MANRSSQPFSRGRLDCDRFSGLAFLLFNMRYSTEAINERRNFARGKLSRHRVGSVSFVQHVAKRRCRRLRVQDDEKSALGGRGREMRRDPSKHFAKTFPEKRKERNSTRQGYFESCIFHVAWKRETSPPDEDTAR